jgi:two-component system OmpR family response regulator
MRQSIRTKAAAPERPLQVDLRKGPSVLVVDDDDGLRGEIVGYLAAQGFAVEGAADAAAMDRTLARRSFDLIVLDVLMPGEDGLSICRRLAGRGGAGLLFMSALGEEIDRILGLELGADDYLPKPCNPRELLARVRAILRRRSGDSPPAHAGYAFEGFTLDILRRELRAPSGAAVLLTGGEFSLLVSFLEHPRRIFSREQLVEASRGYVDTVDRAIDVQIFRLRRKLGGRGGHDMIRTFRGSGYLFDAEVGRY